MQNFALLHAAGESQHPVLLKRGMSATVEELLMAAEYILSHGNRRVILCERGIRTFETATRNTTDINAIPVLESAHPPAGDPRSQPQHRQLAVCRRHRPRRRRRRGGRADRRGASRSRRRRFPTAAQSLKPERFAELVRQVKADRPGHWARHWPITQPGATVPARPRAA